MDKGSCGTCAAFHDVGGIGYCGDRLDDAIASGRLIRADGPRLSHASAAWALENVLTCCDSCGSWHGPANARPKPIVITHEDMAEVFGEDAEYMCTSTGVYWRRYGDTGWMHAEERLAEAGKL